MTPETLRKWVDRIYRASYGESVGFCLMQEERDEVYTLAAAWEADRKRIEVLEQERRDLSEEMMRAVVRSHEQTGTKKIWSDVVHGWAARLTAAIAKAGG